MTNKDMKNRIDVRVGFNPQALSGTNNIVGEIIDRQGFDSLTFALMTDDIAVGSLVAQLLIEESDDSAFSSSNEVADGDLLGTEDETAIDENDDSVVKRIGYVGGKRYVRATLVVDTNAGSDVVACAAILGHAHHSPVAQG